jgi:hypothetical protein
MYLIIYVPNNKYNININYNVYSTCIYVCMCSACVLNKLYNSIYVFIFFIQTTV